jgi:hypothetical protein
MENFRNIFTSMMFLFQISTGQDFKSIMFDIRAQNGFAVAGFFISFYVLAIFVFTNLFVAVLLEAFEREFDDSVSLDMTAEDLIDFKNEWDGKCADLVRKELVLPSRNRCGLKGPIKSLPVRYLREFIEALPEDSVVGHARDLGSSTVWWNRLLYELSKQEKCSIYHIEPHFVHEAEQGQASDRVLDELIEFDEVVRACNLMRSAARGDPDADHLEQLSYGDRLRMQQALDAKREHCAMELLEASVGAWKMLRYPPAEVAERIAADPTGHEQKIWTMQVRRLRVGRFCRVFVCAPLSDLVAHCLRCCDLQVVMARTLMITTVIQRNKIG